MSKPRAYASATAVECLSQVSRVGLVGGYTHSFKVDHPLFCISGDAYIEASGRRLPIV